MYVVLKPPKGLKNAKTKIIIQTKIAHAHSGIMLNFPVFNA